MAQTPIDEETKDIRFLLRLPPSLYDALCLKAETYSLKRSEAARLAIAEWCLGPGAAPVPDNGHPAPERQS